MKKSFIVDRKEIKYNDYKKCQQITSGLAKLGGKVIIQTSARPLTESDNPNGVQSSPNFAKPLGCCMQTDGSALGIKKFD